MAFHRRVLHIDPAEETERIVDLLASAVFETLRRRGGVVGISGGLDSSVVLALAVRALGAGRVLGVLLPERESSPDSERLAGLVARQLGVETVREDVTAPLAAFGCYRRRDAAVRSLFPEYDDTYRVKITLPDNLLEQETLNVFRVTVIDAHGGEQARRLRPQDLREIVAASNLKQRSRMAMLYYHAERRDYAVIGTPNKNEHEQGFFVKFGDGAYDVAPIVHLYKTQVYQLAEYLDVPPEIRQRVPTTDTYSAPVTQEEFFFRLPFETLDLLWYAWEHGVPAAEVAAVMELTVEQVERVWNDLASKRRTTSYLRQAAIRLGDGD
ncbi:MAG: NAD(+) synthase [Anaerolineae bacterium]|nr:NAD(+) synthase [Anaerolineae bacterium]